MLMRWSGIQNKQWELCLISNTNRAVQTGLSLWQNLCKIVKKILFMHIIEIESEAIEKQKQRDIRCLSTHGVWFIWLFWGWPCKSDHFFTPIHAQKTSSFTIISLKLTSQNDKTFLVYKLYFSAAWHILNIKVQVRHWWDITL